jgi:hypothetical protein
MRRSKHCDLLVNRSQYSRKESRKVSREFSHRVGPKNETAGRVALVVVHLCSFCRHRVRSARGSFRIMAELRHADSLPAVIGVDRDETDAFVVIEGDWNSNIHAFDTKRVWLCSLTRFHFAFSDVFYPTVIEGKDLLNKKMLYVSMSNIPFDLKSFLGFIALDMFRDLPCCLTHCHITLQLCSFLMNLCPHSGSQDVSISLEVTSKKFQTETAVDCGVTPTFSNAIFKLCVSYFCGVHHIWILISYEPALANLFTHFLQ